MDNEDVCPREYLGKVDKDDSVTETQIVYFAQASRRLHITENTMINVLTFPAKAFSLN